jgi:hypothetical protein
MASNTIVIRNPFKDFYFKQRESAGEVFELGLEITACQDRPPQGKKLQALIEKIDAIRTLLWEMEELEEATHKDSTWGTGAPFYLRKVEEVPQEFEALAQRVDQWRIDEIRAHLDLSESAPAIPIETDLFASVREQMREVVKDESLLYNQKRELLYQKLADAPDGFRNNVYYQVWKLSGSPLGDHDYGKNHIIDNLNVTLQAIDLA